MRYQKLLFGLSGIVGLLLASRPAAAERTGYSHVTALEGSVSVISDANGRTEAQVNLPLATGDQLITQAGARVEIELADGNGVQVAGESQLRLDSLAGEEGSDADESALTLMDGSLAVESVQSDDAHAFRIDTADATVYLSQQAQVRINLDANRGTSVIVRQGSADVQSRTGSRTVEAGSYLMVHGEQEPEVARGTFSRDRFDMWVADRSNTILQAYNSTSSRYVDRGYSTDAAELDRYGRWDYSSTSQTTVWRPDVDADWAPYVDGYWYDTPIGASWVPNEPWGWFPFHYGNWFFDAAFGSWCWSPAYAFAPAWVYWCYSPSFVGWCPIGYYSYYGPYCNYWGFDALRRGLYFSVSGIFDPRRVDFRRGWNFVNVKSLGTRFTRGTVLPGRTVAGRLGGSVAITSSPMRAVVTGRVNSGAAALRSFARTAPEMISRQNPAMKSAALAPFLGRQKSLPPATLAALKTSGVAKVDPVRGGLTGPGSSGLPVASRRLESSAEPGRLSGGFGTAQKADAWRTPSGGGSKMASAPPSTSGGADWRTSGRVPSRLSPGSARPSELSSPRRGFPSVPDRAQKPLSPQHGEATPRAGSVLDWRTRGRSSSSDATREPRGAAPLAPRSGIGANRYQQPLAPRKSPTGGELSSRFSPGRGTASESWRSRASMPPAQRVIEGIDRGRAVAPPRSAPERRFQPPPTQRYEAPRSAPMPRYEARPASPSPHSSGTPKETSRGQQPRR